MCRIDDNFYTLVGQDREAERSFTTSIKNQLLEKLNVSENLIKNVYATPGNEGSLLHNYIYITSYIIL